MSIEDPEQQLSRLNMLIEDLTHFSQALNTSEVELCYSISFLSGTISLATETALQFLY
jgi:hypothetical protein